jgi:4-hydroxybenzoate polyprenyltransferase
VVSVRDWIELFRPSHWVKNFFVLGPLFFSGRLFDKGAVWNAIGAFAAFCLVSSAVYALNDVADRAADQVHPIKRLRPVASGRIATRQAGAASAILAFAGVAAAAAVSFQTALLAAGYLALNAAYSWRLKQVVVLDVFILATFFILRLVAGSVAVGVMPSIWLLLCGGLLALYLGFTKRRHELVLLGSDSAGHRSVLSRYNAAFLDQMSTVLLAVTVVCYIMYTLDSDTAHAVGTEMLSYSTAFVLYGVFRYLYLVHQNEGGSPTRTLLTDRHLLGVVALWVVYCGMVIYRPQ